MYNTENSCIKYFTLLLCYIDESSVGEKGATWGRQCTLDEYPILLISNWTDDEEGSGVIRQWHAEESVVSRIHNISIETQLKCTELGWKYSAGNLESRSFKDNAAPDG